MIVKVLGYERIFGSASKKTGKPFDFYKVHYSCIDRRVTGEAVSTLILQAAEYPAPLIGCNYDAQFNQSGFLIDFVEA